jgi:myo-inositol-1(or 4)-monophosphatase
MLNRAIAFATKAHQGQFRKGTNNPYIIHPMEVAGIVASMTTDEEVICAAVLHDTIEDCDGVDESVLQDAFGERIAYLVSQESEDKSKSWRERKGATIRHLRSAPSELKLIGLADKLSNMRDIHRDAEEVGDELWKRFRLKSKDAIEWYYKGIQGALAEEFSGVPAYEEYCKLVEETFGSGPALLQWE